MQMVEHAALGTPAYGFSSPGSPDQKFQKLVTNFLQRWLTNPTRSFSDGLQSAQVQSVGPFQITCLYLFLKRTLMSVINPFVVLMGLLATVSDTTVTRYETDLMS